MAKKEEEDQTTKPLKNKKKKQKKPLAPEEVSKIMWMNARNSHRHQVERSRPSWITSDDVLDGTNYIDPEDYYNPYRNRGY
tara:strand:+ start:1252 stop:1494 length:243 start_codon:yes stop_codon:yes gene_type:complete